MKNLHNLNAWFSAILLLFSLGITGWMEVKAQTPTGALSGLFSVSENTGVVFSQGNLQYQASTNTWRFAENQYDYLGSDNSNISSSYTGWIDLFGWGTSGYNHGANCYQPWSTSTSNSDYEAYGNSSYHLFDQTGQADWGYNAISNGGNEENSGWHTLSKEEWNYLLNIRITTSGLCFAMAKVNNVNGVILLPDNWQTSCYLLNSTNTYYASFSTNVITATEWATLEQHGAVFLPAAGYRNCWTSVSDVNYYGKYWSASYSNSYQAYVVDFWWLGLGVSDYGRRDDGYSVRLVRSVEKCSIHATPSPAVGGTVSGAGDYMVGTECTLTATASAGYTFAYWTEEGEVVSTEPAYSFTVTGDRVLVAHFTDDSQGGTLQTLTLTPGWNWVSSYVDYRPETLQEMQEAIASECEEAVIKSEVDGFVNYAMGAWDGSLSSMDNFQMYMVKVDHEMSLEFEGDATELEGHPVNLVPGWNWLGYPVNKPLELKEVLSDLQPKEGDLIKDQNSFSTYEISEGGWHGTLTTLEPGKGYVYLSVDQDSKNFVMAGPSVPVLTTEETRMIGSSTATCHGTVVRSGGFGITECGLCWNTTGNPTIYDSHVTAELIDKHFSAGLEGLADGTEYYVRAYAINLMGVGYGDERVFSTLPLVDGTVDLPENMASADILITNFIEEVVPDEEGNFEIGYNNVLMAENQENGEVIYMSIVSVDYEGSGSRRGDEVLNSCPLTAKETAITLALQMLPYGLSQSKDETFNSIKEVLYSLDCVKDLETAIETVVAQYGYLNMEVLSDPLLAVRDFYMEELFPEEMDGGEKAEVTPVGGTITLRGDGNGELNSPHMPISSCRGIRIDIESASYNPSSDTWSLNMTAYSDNGIYVGLNKGHINENGQAQLTGEKTRYFIPPMNAGKFMGTFVSWSGLKAYFEDTRRLLTEEGFWFDDMTWSMAKLENIRMEIGVQDDALIFQSPWDDNRTAIVNAVYTVFGTINCWLSVEGIQKFFLSLFLDENFIMLFLRNWNQGEEGFNVVATELCDRFKDFMYENTIDPLAELK